MSRWAALVLKFTALLMLLYGSPTLAEESRSEKFCSSVVANVDFKFFVATKVREPDKFQLPRIILSEFEKFISSHPKPTNPPTEGRIVVGLVIDKTGRVAHAARLEPPEATQYDFLVDAMIQKVLFQPAMMNGEATNACTVLPMSFLLQH